MDMETGRAKQEFSVHSMALSFLQTLGSGESATRFSTRRVIGAIFHENQSQRTSREQEMRPRFSGVGRTAGIFALVTCPSVTCVLLVCADAIGTRTGKLEFDAGHPPQATVTKLDDELGFQRAVQAYLGALLRGFHGAPAIAVTTTNQAGIAPPR